MCGDVPTPSPHMSNFPVVYGRRGKKIPRIIGVATLALLVFAGCESVGSWEWSELGVGTTTNGTWTSDKTTIAPASDGGAEVHSYRFNSGKSAMTLTQYGLSHRRIVGKSLVAANPIPETQSALHRGAGYLILLFIL